MLTERERVILAVVEAGEGRYDARWIDITVSSKIRPGPVTVLQELRSLEERGLVEMSDRETGVGGRWRITQDGAKSLVGSAPLSKWEMSVREMFSFSDGRIVFVGPIDGGPPPVGERVCDMFVDGEPVYPPFFVTLELPERREPSDDRSLSTSDHVEVTATTVRDHDVRLRAR